MASTALLESAKLALRIKTDAFDAQISGLLESAMQDLGIAGITASCRDPLITTALITYVRLHFGQPDDYDRLKASYDEQKAQLSMASGYTYWGRLNG